MVRCRSQILCMGTKTACELQRNFHISLSPSLSVYQLRAMTCLSRTYFITAPNRVRPGQVLQVFVSVFELTHPHLIVSAAVRREQHEVCSATKSFLPGSSSLMQMQVRAWPPSCLFTNLPFNEIGCKCFVKNQVSVLVYEIFTSFKVVSLVLDSKVKTSIAPGASLLCASKID